MNQKERERNARPSVRPNAEAVLEAALAYARAADTYTDHQGLSEYEDGDEAARSRVERECRETMEAAQRVLNRASLSYLTAHDNSYWEDMK